MIILLSFTDKQTHITAPHYYSGAITKTKHYRMEVSNSEIFPEHNGKLYYLNMFD